MCAVGQEYTQMEQKLVKMAKCMLCGGRNGGWSVHLLIATQLLGVHMQGEEDDGSRVTLKTHIWYLFIQIFEKKKVTKPAGIR